jgi:hypothetical protein
MINRYLSFGFLAVCGFQAVFAESAMAQQSSGGVTPPGACQDLVIVMKDDSADAVNSKKMTVFLDCHETSGNLPSATTMNFFIFDQGRLCHGYRVCGNLRGWEGTFRLGGAYYFGGHFGDAFDVADNCGENDTSCRSYDHPYGGFGFGNPHGGYGGYGGYGPGYGYGGRSNVRMDFITKFSNIDRHCGSLQQYQCLDLPSYPVVYPK